jgi:hypothetical protein
VLDEEEQPERCSGVGAVPATKPRAGLGFRGPARRGEAEHRDRDEKEDEEAAEPRRCAAAPDVSMEREHQSRATVPEMKERKWERWGRGQNGWSQR